MSEGESAAGRIPSFVYLVVEVETPRVTLNRVGVTARTRRGNRTRTIW